MSRNSNYAIENLLDYFYLQNGCKFIDIDISRQTNAAIP